MADNQQTNRQGWNFEHTYSELPQIFHSSVQPNPVPSPQLVVLNNPLARQLGLSIPALSPEAAAELFSGNKIPAGSRPLAQSYAGHQFGNFAMLGDGRALLLGEQITPDGNKFDVQLKGSGPTPYSRRGDGRAALKPMLREYIISEAMHALGIPTTRSLAVVATGEPVLRETVLKGAVLTRIAASHLRVGTFEFARAHSRPEELQALIEYALIRHYPEAFASENSTLELLLSVIDRQARLMSRWMSVGFIHGVMNTDNMTISGETIDYGPCAFMDTYNPSTVFSSIDREGRYAYANQPKIALWNLERLAESLLPFLHEDEEKAVELAQNALETYADIYNDAWLTEMRHKLGLFDSDESDATLITELLSLMYKYKADYTNTFRNLCKFSEGLPDSQLFSAAEFNAWCERWNTRRDSQHREQKHIVELMRQSNPNVIPRNHRVEEALSAADAGDISVMTKLMEVLASPFADTPVHAEYTAPAGPEFSGYRTFCGT